MKLLPPPPIVGEYRQTVRRRPARPGLVRQLGRFHRRVGPLYVPSAVKFLQAMGKRIPPPRSVYNPQDLFGEQFWNYFRPVKPSVDWAAFKQAVHLTRKAFPVKRGSLTAVRLEDVVSEIDISKNAGLPTLKRKGLVIKESLKLALKILHGDVKPPPCVAFHRSQPGKVRLVWGYPFSMTLLEGTLMVPIERVLRALETPYPGWRTGLGVAGRVVSTTWSELQLCLDWSKFDSTVPKIFLEAVWDIIASWFSRDPDTQRKVEVVRAYFLTAGILMPDGYIYEGRTRGIPSGSWFTQLVGSMANYMLIAYLTIVTRSHVRLDRVLVFGDDSIVPLYRFPDLAAWARAADDLGMRIHPEKQVLTHGNPHFLGHYWSGGRWWRSEEDTLQSLATLERWPRVPDFRAWELMRVKALVVDNPSQWPLLSRYWKYLTGSPLTPYHVLRGYFHEGSTVPTGILQSLRRDWVFVGRVRRSFVQQLLVL